jgi:hypothetical protein
MLARTDKVIEKALQLSTAQDRSQPKKFCMAPSRRRARRGRARESMISKSGNHFSENDRAQTRSWSVMTIRGKVILL